MGKNVAVFVDVANIFYAAKAAGVDIDYVTLLKAAVAGRDFVRAYAYTGLDPENENQRNFHAFLSRNGYKVVSKDIRKYGDGKVKANLDIELVVDMMKLARNLDVAIVVSGDGDFAPAIRAVQEMGVRVEVISFRGNTSSDLIDVADIFTDIVHLAKVDKSSTRSGRRVTADEEDLSMTEVPEKQTEGTGRGRGSRGGRGRGGRTGERGAERLEPVATGGRQRNGASAGVAALGGAAVGAAAVGGAAPGGGAITVLPGEKLSKVAAAAPARPIEDEEAVVAEEDETAEALEASAELAEGAIDGAAAEGAEAGEEGEPRRRRRRRGGRGRGRGRGREEGEYVAGPAPADEEEVPLVPRGPRPTPFGSVWDSQIGLTRTTPAANLTPLPIDEEDLEEPEIPEYLLAEQRRRGRPQGGGQGGRGGRGARSAYAAAIDRERYGRGGGSGINRYPDVSGRVRPERLERQDRARPEPRREERSGGGQGPRQERRHDEPWSEVPPELEQMLRAQLANRPRSEPSRPAQQSGRGQERVEAGPATEQATATPGGEAETQTGRGGAARRRGGRPATSAAAGQRGGAPEAAASERAASEPTADAASGAGTRRTRSPRARSAAASAPASAGTEGSSAETLAAAAELSPSPAASPARQGRGRAAGRKTGAAEESGASADVAAAPAGVTPAASTAAPRRRSPRGAASGSTPGTEETPRAAVESGTASASRTRRRPAPAQADAPAEGTSAADAPKRRTTRRRATPEAAD